MMGLYKFIFCDISATQSGELQRELEKNGKDESSRLELKAKTLLHVILMT